MKIKNQVLICMALITLSCGKAKDSSSTIGGIDKPLVEKAENLFCGRNQKLTELKSGTNVSFYNLNQQSRIFAFSTANMGDDSCIVLGSLNENIRQNGQDMWFKLNPNNQGNCLKNNSIWEVRSSHNTGQEQFYYLKNIDDPGTRFMEMSAHQDLNGTYARDRVGLKILQCQ